MSLLPMHDELEQHQRVSGRRMLHLDGYQPVTHPCQRVNDKGIIDIEMVSRSACSAS